MSWDGYLETITANPTSAATEGGIVVGGGIFGKEDMSTWCATDNLKLSPENIKYFDQILNEKTAKSAPTTVIINHTKYINQTSPYEEVSSAHLLGPIGANPHGLEQQVIYAMASNTAIVVGVAEATGASKNLTSENVAKTANHLVGCGF